MVHSDQLSEKQGSPRKTILVVDDDTDVGAFLLTVLTTEAHYQALLATNARQALDTVETVIPDLFMLDYQLPDSNGLELAYRLSAIPALTSVPILLMSAHFPKSVPEVDNITFIAKPFELDNLLHAIAQLLATD